MKETNKERKQGEESTSKDKKEGGGVERKGKERKGKERSEGEMKTE